MIKEKLKSLTIGIKDKLVNKFKSKIRQAKVRKDEYDTLEIQKELERLEYKHQYLKVVKDIVFTIIIVFAILIIISNTLITIVKTNVTSLSGKYKKNDIVLILNTDKIEIGDMIAFYHGNKILIKRVVAIENSIITIDSDGVVKVDEKNLDGKYPITSDGTKYDLDTPYQVPVDSWFVISDQENDYIDSRNMQIGCVTKENLIGKIIISI